QAVGEGLLRSDRRRRPRRPEGARRPRLPRRRPHASGSRRAHLLHEAARSRVGDGARRRALEPPAVIRTALVVAVAAALLAGCSAAGGGGGAGAGTATLWLTRDE